MKKIEIDILSNTKLNSSYDIEPSFPILYNDNLIVWLNSIDWSDRGKKRNEFSVASYNINNGKVLWETKFESEVSNGIKCDFVITGKHILGCSSHELFSIDLETGKLNWCKKLEKHTSPKLSKIDEKIYWSNWGELQEINPSNGKKIKSLKPRVKGFDSKVIKYNERYFTSTANSKIIELDIDELTVINEFKYKGGWAIACEPYFFRNLMISNSYGSKTLVFNLNDNSEIKRFNRKTGAKPIQKGINENFISYHGNSDSKLTCYDLNSLKKKWTKEIERVQYISVTNESIEFIYKEEDYYRIGKLNMKESDEIVIQSESKYQNWQNYQFDLWEGVSIINDGKRKIYNYEPNKIQCITIDKK